MANSDEVQASISCCFGNEDQSENEEPESPFPCDERKCPTTCCTSAMQIALATPCANGLLESQWSNDLAIPNVELDLSQPHLLRLKRPPRAV